MPTSPTVSLCVSTLARAWTSVGITVVRRWCRQHVDLRAPLPDGPVLFVANHGFGGMIDLNAHALDAVLEEHRPGRRPVVLVDRVAWTLGAGPLVKALGGRPARRRAALAALAEGRDVVVFPGGDIEAAKSWQERDQVLLQGRTGFAHLALQADVPIVPIVTAGAGESLLVLPDGQGLARRLHLDGLLRMKSLPVSVSLPWGLSVGGVGLLPYLPLPTRLETAVLPPMRRGPGEDAAALAARVQQAMQDAMHDLTDDRRYLRGRPSS
jgi:1-acyl-sn-glycerol-3-phosphate acyltransferase